MGLDVLVLGAGGPAGVNVCGALEAAGHNPIAADQNAKHLVWTHPWETAPWPPRLGAAEYDVAMAQPDGLVTWLSDRREEAGTTFLPSAQTIALCQDKYECGLQWRRTGQRQDKVFLVDSEVSYWDASAILGTPFWMRARHGAGARGAIVVREPEQGHYWYRFWKSRNWDTDFICEGYLPGADYSWCGVFDEGLMASFQRQRIEYIYPHLSPEGLTGTPTIAEITAEPVIHDAALRAVKAVDRNPRGVFCVDLKEDEEGYPRPTEINAGRFSTTVGLWSQFGTRSNFVALAAELAVGDRSRLDDWEKLPTGLTLSRHIDCGHVFTREQVLV